MSDDSFWWFYVSSHVHTRPDQTENTSLLLRNVHRYILFWSNIPTYVSTECPCTAATVDTVSNLKRKGL